MRIGVDVGGTNTDAVLMQGDKVVATCKQPTTKNVSAGVVKAINTVLSHSNISADAIRCVMIGTTQFTNAFVERKKLMPVGILRIALPAASAIPPLVDWPEDILNSIERHTVMVGGGHQFDGRINAPLDEDAIVAAAKQFKQAGLRTVAVTSVFSSINSEMEERAEQILRAELGDIAITLSHTIGKTGLLERENATIMNASLADLSTFVIDSFRQALAELEIRCPFYISQNDGTLMDAGTVERYPVLTFASGPTNSMRGAAYLSGLKDALVADIGGTTTDIGVLTNGFPRESSLTADIGGVRTNFRMPDVLALGLGGGSLIGEADGEPTIGPKSVGYELLQRALIYGGKELTASDIAVAAGYAEFGEKSKVTHLDAELVARTVKKMHAMVSDGVDRMKTNSSPIPLVLVGGGAVLINGEIEGVSEVIVPEHAGVANAIGASIAQISGESDRIYSYQEIGRETALREAEEAARDKAIQAGAMASTIEVIDIEEVPLAYAVGGAVRVRVKVAGGLDLGGAS